MITGRYDERPEEPVRMYGSTGTTIRWLINKENGAQTFAMRRFVLQPGAEIPLHEHEADHEIYILSGEGIAFTENQEVVVKQDMFVYISSNEPHGYRNTSDSPFVFLCVVPILD